MKIEDFKKKNEEQIFVIDGGEQPPLLKYKKLEEIPWIRHCFTTREGGASKGIFAELNLSFTRGDEEAAVRENYRRVAKRMGTEVSHFVCSDQTHTTNVRVVTQEDAGAGVVRERGYTDVDGLITNEPGLVLSTFYADCGAALFCRYRASCDRAFTFRLAWYGRKNGCGNHPGDAKTLRNRSKASDLCDRTIHLSGLL